MKTIKSAIATLISIATLAITATSASACSETADKDTIPNLRPVPIQELDPVSLADFMGNPYPNAFCDFRIVTNAEMENPTDIIVGQDIFSLSGEFCSETTYVYALFNTRGTADVTDDIIISVYESPTDEVSELALYENLYNDMWSLR